MLKITNVTKYQLKEVLSTAFFFSIVTFTIIYIKGEDDFPLLRGFVAAAFISLSVFFLEVFLVKLLHKYFTSLMLFVLSIFYYLLVFVFMLISSIYVILIFKNDMPIEKAIHYDITKLIPNGVNEMVFYMFIFLTIRFLIIQLRYRTLHGTAIKLIWGKAGDTVKDKRIFMFMDLKSSTTFAEKLGYSVYSKFIKDIYQEIDEFILETKGQIYQYVGDEVVVVWSLQNGLKNYNCLRFYYLFENRIKEMEDYFTRTYGIIPNYKAAFHFGEVAVAEIGGILRRDVAFHGDAVNTTARICAKCRDIEEKVLISKDLKDKLVSYNKDDIFISLGKYNLKGKSNEMELYKISEIGKDKILTAKRSNSTLKTSSYL